jgi:hypothetical protein
MAQGRVGLPIGAITGVVLVGALIIAVWAAPQKVPDANPTDATPIGTMARAQPGDRLVITAGVVRVLSTDAFIVNDADLPPQGLLVLSPAVPNGVRQTALVRLDGVVTFFRSSEFPHLSLGDSALLRPYEDEKALIADQITLW